MGDMSGSCSGSQMLLQKQPQECSGGGSRMPQGWGFSLSLSTSCAGTNEEPGKNHCGRLTQRLQAAKAFSFLVTHPGPLPTKSSQGRFFWTHS